MSFHHKRAPAAPLQGTAVLYMIVVVHEIERVYFKYIVFHIKYKIKVNWICLLKYMIRMKRNPLVNKIHYLMSTSIIVWKRRHLKRSAIHVGQTSKHCDVFHIWSAQEFTTLCRSTCCLYALQVYLLARNTGGGHHLWILPFVKCN